MKTLFLLTLLKFPFWVDPTFRIGGFTVKVNIKGFENNSGKAYVALYDVKEKRLKSLIESINNQKVTVNFTDLSSGKYAVRVFQDENNNSKLDTGLFGIPKEKWGVSNNIKPLMSAPKFEDILFEVIGNKEITINLQ